MGRDYVIFERNSVPGSFFEKYPRHRKLISINKRYTGRKNREFNLRHDWNSLLTDDFSILFTNYSKEYFPQADCLLKYLKDFSEKFKLKVKFNTKISDIAYNKNVANERCRFTMKDQMERSICCRVLCC
uniref:Uncharacterized protein n=1 Tax=Romanomermis culicivorax TaxID=13658 RepID=A0A915L5M9_ROMCU